MHTDADVLLLGSGLANSLIALRLAARRPDVRVLLLERKPGPDDEHTWCCFDSDLRPEQREWLRPLLSNHWDGYEVRFPAFARRLETGYGRLESQRLAQALESACPGACRHGAQVTEVGPEHVALADGTILRAPLVIDGRGARPSSTLAVAWQKFIGLEVVVAEPHGLTRPVVMDAAVPQLDGFRFIYVLPLDERRLLIEDTRYSDGAEIDAEALADQVRAYARGQGWSIIEERRLERGALPILLGGDPEEYWREVDGPAASGGAALAGMRALLFHPVTGYSLPEAVRLADLIAGAPVLETATVAERVRARSRRTWRRGAYLRLLNRMLFRAAEPDQRYRVLQRFYRLPEKLIQRFYANRLTWADRLRILAGRPPVPLMSAARAIRLNTTEHAVE